MTIKIMNRDSLFSYKCNACGRCCVNKRIQTNPYEVLRLADKLGLKTAEFCRQYLEKNGPYLRVTEEGACVFLMDKACTVHQDRPIACRTYPLGRWVSAEYEETFKELKAHPKSEGVYAQDATIAQYLADQGVNPYLQAADRYQALFYRMFDVLQLVKTDNAELAGNAESAMFKSNQADMPAFMEWLDVDTTVERYCNEQGLVPPDTIMAKMDLHIQAIDKWLDKLSGDMS